MWVGPGPGDRLDPQRPLPRLDGHARHPPVVGPVQPDRHPEQPGAAPDQALVRLGQGGELRMRRAREALAVVARDLADELDLAIGERLDGPIFAVKSSQVGRFVSSA